MFSQTVEYALRAVVAMAAEPDKAVKTREISELTRIPADYLFKVLRTLSKAGIVTSIRGISGGVKLSRNPDDISILEVISAIDPLPRIKKCPLDITSHREKLCPLHSRMDKAMESMEEAFKGVSLAQLAKESGSDGPFCK